MEDFSSKEEKCEQWRYNKAIGKILVVNPSLVRRNSLKHFTLKKRRIW
ncbi:MAG: hypothetical protein K6C05_03355 [Anaerovibrio sp.]|nr:hypothetical protein [Anaerovibrio sp.]MCR5175869.1 hypothetical protein [Anaerovibrio sp.]